MTIQNIVFSQLATAHAGPNPVVALVFGMDGVVEPEDPNGVDPETGIYRGSGVVVGVGWQQAAPLDVTVKAPWMDAEPLPLVFAANLPLAVASFTHFAAPWIMDFELANLQAVAVFGEAVASRAELVAPWLELFDIPAAGVAAVRRSRRALEQTGMNGRAHQPVQRSQRQQGMAPTPG